MKEFFSQNIGTGTFRKMKGQLDGLSSSFHSAFKKSYRQIFESDSLFIFEMNHKLSMRKS
jgi:hypothetical protein